jgi:hypothetical protein
MRSRAGGRSHDDVLLDALVPIFAVMALGDLASSTREIDNHHVAALNARW